MPAIQLWDRVRALFRKANLYRTDNIYQDQTSLDKIVSDGGFIDISKQSSLLEQTNLQINRLERYKDYDMMDEVGEVSLALDMYSDEASLTDSERKHVIVVRARSTRLKKIIEEFLYDTILFDREARPILRYLCKFGDCAWEIIPTSSRDGVASIRFLNVYNLTRVQTRFGDLVGYFYQDQTVTKPIFLNPWQVMHMRLSSLENIYAPYGRSILDGGRKDFKRLRLMEDAALIYRVTRAPEKRIFSIPVGNIPADQVPQYIELIARQMKKHKFVDPATGQVNERWSPLIQEDDFWLPKRSDGTGPTIDTLPGAENLDKIADIEYFKKKMVAGFKIPFNRVGIGDQTEPSGKSLASTSPEFAKAVQWIQREAVVGIKKLVLVHLALRGCSINEMRSFDLTMTSASAIDELYRIETWNTRADVIKNLQETKLFPDRWIMERFAGDMTDDEIRQMQRAKDEREQIENASGPGGPAEMYDREDEKLIREYRELVEDMPTENEEYRTAVSWYVNSKELDGLKGSEGSIVDESIDPVLAEEVKKVTERMLISGNDEEDEEAPVGLTKSNTILNEDLPSTDTSQDPSLDQN